jgi:hypothetical protein
MVRSWPQRRLVDDLSSLVAVAAPEAPNGGPPVASVPRFLACADARQRRGAWMTLTVRGCGQNRSAVDPESGGQPVDRSRLVTTFSTLLSRPASGRPAAALGR